MAKLTPIAAAIVFVCLVWPGAGHAATDDLQRYEPSSRL